MTVANMITILRFLLVPAVIYWLLTGEWRLAFAGFLIILPVTIVTQDNVDPWLLTPEERPVPDWDKVTAGLMN